MTRWSRSVDTSVSLQQIRVVIPRVVIPLTLLIGSARAQPTWSSPISSQPSPST